MFREAELMLPYVSSVLLVSLIIFGNGCNVASEIFPCPHYARGEVLPWIIEMEIRAGAKIRVFLGVLISLRSVVSCCSCTLSLNPNVTSVDRFINAELETISAKAVDSFTTYQVRYVQQVVSEAPVCDKQEKKEAWDRGFYDDDNDYSFIEGNRKDDLYLRYISISILDLAFYWNQTFAFPRMPYPPRPETVSLQVKHAIENPEKIQCWTQTQIYKTRGDPENLREVNTSLVWYNVTFTPGQHETAFLLEALAVKTRDTNRNNTLLAPGSPLICEDMTIGILTTAIAHDANNISMKFIQFDHAYFFMVEFDLLYRYFPASSSLLLPPASLLALSLIIPNSDFIVALRS